MKLTTQDYIDQVTADINTSKAAIQKSINLEVAVSWIRTSDLQFIGLTLNQAEPLIKMLAEINEIVKDSEYIYESTRAFHKIRAILRGTQIGGRK